MRHAAIDRFCSRSGTRARAYYIYSYNEYAWHRPKASIYLQNCLSSAQQSVHRLSHELLFMQTHFYAEWIMYSWRIDYARPAQRRLVPDAYLIYMFQRQNELMMLNDNARDRQAKKKTNIRYSFRLFKSTSVYAYSFCCDITTHLFLTWNWSAPHSK